MSNDFFPSKELLEVIRGQARMEEKIDSILRLQSDLRKRADGMEDRLDGHEKRISNLESKRASDKAYVAGLASSFGVGASFLIPYLKQKLGL